MKSISIAKKLAILSVLCIALPTLLFSLSLYNSQVRQFYRQQLRDRQNVVEQLAGNIETNYDTISDLARSLAYRPNLITLLSRREPARYPISSAKYIDEVVSSIKYSTRYQGMGVQETYIFAENGLENSSYFYDASLVRSLGFYQDFTEKERESSLYYLSPEESSQFTEAVKGRRNPFPKETFLLVQVVRDNYLDPIGCLVFEISPYLFFRGIAPSIGSTDGYFAYFTGNGNYYGASPSKELAEALAAQAQEGGTYLSLDGGRHPYRWISGMDLVVCDAKAVGENMHVSSALSLSLFLAALALVQTFLLNLFIKRIFGKLNRSLNQMDAIVADGFRGSLPLDGNDEVGQIILRFNLLLKKISLLVSDVVKKETAGTKAQIKALQYQMNPHFIYNTLSIFSGHAEQHGNSDLAEAIASFGHLLRYNIKDTGAYATVESELRNAISLMSVYAIRYVNQLQLEIHAEPGVRRARIIKFLLQPLMENSILHGLCPPCSSMLIQILIRREEGDLLVQVRDNGVGMTPQRLEEVRSCILGEKTGEIPQTEGSFIGLKNICERLALFYGGQAAMEIESTEGSGVCISIRIPFSSEEEG